MDTLMIKKLLKTFPCFKGVFPCDQLPYDANLPINIIANTDPANLPGEHWICISIKKNGRGQYFDSFGLPPLKEELFYSSDKIKKMLNELLEGEYIEEVKFL